MAFPTGEVWREQQKTARDTEKAGGRQRESYERSRKIKERGRGGGERERDEEREKEREREMEQRPAKSRTTRI